MDPISINTKYYTKEHEITGLNNGYAFTSRRISFYLRWHCHFKNLFLEISSPKIASQNLCDIIRKVDLCVSGRIVWSANGFVLKPLNDQYCLETIVIDDDTVLYPLGMLNLCYSFQGCPYIETQLIVDLEFGDRMGNVKLFGQKTAAAHLRLPIIPKYICRPQYHGLEVVNHASTKCIPINFCHINTAILFFFLNEECNDFAKTPPTKLFDQVDFVLKKNDEITRTSYSATDIHYNGTYFLIPLNTTRPFDPIIVENNGLQLNEYEKIDLEFQGLATEEYLHIGVIGFMFLDVHDERNELTGLVKWWQ